MAAKNNKKNEENQSDKEKKSEKMEEEFYYALNHEIRRKIIRMIGESDQCSFTLFKKTLKIGTGTLYHHLDVLKNIITQNENRKYILTNLGNHAYRILIRNQDSLESNKIDEEKGVSEQFKKFTKILPKNLFTKMNENQNFAIIITSIFLLGYLILISIGLIDSYFMFFVPFNDILSPMDYFILPLKFLITLLISIFLTEFLCRFLFQKIENTKNLFLLYPVAIFPMGIYLIFYNILSIFSVSLLNSEFNKIIMIIFQIWTIWSISYILSVYKYIKLERGLLITFLIHYIWFNVLLFSQL